MFPKPEEEKYDDIVEVLKKIKKRNPSGKVENLLTLRIGEDEPIESFHMRVKASLTDLTEVELQVGLTISLMPTGIKESLGKVKTEA
ncbi:hypothetical protein Ciccas_009342, partial [Cichlidogyrus casuarinus]